MRKCPCPWSDADGARDRREPVRRDGPRPSSSTTPRLTCMARSAAVSYSSLEHTEFEPAFERVRRHRADPRGLVVADDVKARSQRRPGGRPSPNRPLEHLRHDLMAFVVVRNEPMVSATCAQIAHPMPRDQKLLWTGEFGCSIHVCRNSPMHGVLRCLRWTSNCLIASSTASGSSASAVAREERKDHPGPSTASESSPRCWGFRPHWCVDVAGGYSICPRAASR